MREKAQRGFMRVMAAVLSAAMTVGVTAGTLGIIEANVTSASAAETEEYTSNDFKYTVLDDGTAEITGYVGSNTSLVIPSQINGKNVTVIGEEAFYDCDTLTSVTITDNITTIKDRAFMECSKLVSIVISNNVTFIGDYVFESCSSLLRINVRAGNTMYSSKDGVLFDKNQTKLIKYPTAKNGAYSMPDSVTMVEDAAFINSKNLTGITISKNMKTIPKSMLSYCLALENVTIPNGIVFIEDKAFDNCDKLTEITIPESVTQIGDYAFWNCNGLISINVSSENITYSSKDGMLFDKNKTELLQYPAGKTAESYTISGNITAIGNAAFCHCTALTSITIPNSVTAIGNDAFCYCTALTSITIPDSVTSIGYNTFESCTSLKSIIIPNSVTTLNGYAFWNCTALTNVTLSNNIKMIDAGVFLNCNALTSVTIPSSVSIILQCAFEGCTGLTSVNIPDNVTGIGASSFEGCDNLTICGNQGSYAETYATENNIPFKANFENKSVISATTITKGTEITLTGKAVGGTGSYQYAMLARHEDSSSWTVLKNYNTASTKKWTPAKTGTYKVAIKVKDSNGKVVEKIFTVTVNKPVTLANASTVSAASITKGTEITLTGKASGGTAPYKFQMVAKHENDTKWTVLKDYNTTSTKKWTPAKTGTYKVAIKVKDSSGKVVEKLFTITVNSAALANASTVSATSITKGTEITLTGKASGGIAPYKFQMVAKHENDTKWTVLKDYGTTSTKKWTPAKTGTYKVAIKVKDSSGKVVEKLFTITVE